VNAVVSNILEAKPGASTTRFTPRKTSGQKAQAKPTGQRMKIAMPVEYVHAAAATSAAPSRQPSSRAKRNAPSAATKCAIAAVNVRLCATGSRQASSVKGLYAAGCAAAARMSPERMKRFQSGHS
jgi:hypothetical protein